MHSYAICPVGAENFLAGKVCADLLVGRFFELIMCASELVDMYRIILQKLRPSA